MNDSRAPDFDASTRLLSSNTQTWAVQNIGQQYNQLSVPKLSPFGLARMAAGVVLSDLIIRSSAAIFALLFKMPHLEKSAGDSFSDFPMKYIKSNECTVLDTLSHPSLLTLASFFFCLFAFSVWRNSLAYDFTPSSNRLLNLFVRSRVASEKMTLCCVPLLTVVNLCSYIGYIGVEYILPMERFRSCFNVLFATQFIANMPNAFEQLPNSPALSSFLLIGSAAIILSLLLPIYYCTRELLNALNHSGITQKRINALLDDLNSSRYTRMKEKFKKFAEENELSYSECPIAKSRGMELSGLSNLIRHVFLAPDFIEYDRDNFKLYCQHLMNQKKNLVSPVFDQEEIRLNEVDIAELDEEGGVNNFAACKVTPTVVNLDDAHSQDDEVESEGSDKIIELADQVNIREDQFISLCQGTARAHIGEDELRPEECQIRRFNVTSAFFYSRLSLTSRDEV